jgi:hypothetical protein
VQGDKRATRTSRSHIVFVSEVSSNEGVAAVQMVTVTEAGGKTKAITSAGVEDTKNDIMFYSVVEAENYDIAARAFAKHPHLDIPRASIQVMEVRALGPM